MELLIAYRSMAAGPARGWARRQFGGAALGDKRRNRRVVKLAAAMAESPGENVPQLGGTWYGVKAAYTLFDRPEATPEALQASHRALVREEASRPGTTVLWIEDPSTYSWSGKQRIPGLGPIGAGDEGQQGFFLQTVLGVRWPQGLKANLDGERPTVELLGVGDQQYIVRRRRLACEEKRAWARAQGLRESRFWMRAPGRLGPAPPGVRWKRVADRGADIYEYLRNCQRYGQEFLVRATQDRVVLSPGTGKRLGRLFTVARAGMPLGTFTLALRARPGQKARTATLTVAVAGPVWIASPARPGHGPGKLPPVPATIVRVYEANPPKGVKKPLEWILLNNTPVDSFAAAYEVALQYETRWIVEEYTKAVKTGLGAERLQLHKARRLFAAIAVMTVVALRLIDLRERARVEPDAPADRAPLTDQERAVLRAYTGRRLRTVRDVILALGRLGGHLNRTADGLPGWITLWRGWHKLRLLIRGARLAIKLNRSG